ALVGGVAQQPVSGPLRELDLAHELRLDEVRAARRLASGERRIASRERAQQAGEPRERVLVKAGSHPSGVTQRALLIDAEVKRADALGARALPRGPTADHRLLRLFVLDLQPAAVAPPGQVARVQLLCDDPLQFVLAGCLLQSAAFAALVGRNA